MTGRLKEKPERRLASLIAGSGVASRRKAEEFIKNGLVTVNRKVVIDPGIKVRPGRDRIEVAGEVLKSSDPRAYYLLNKPAGYLSTCSDPRGRRTVLELVPGEDRRLFPVGRLDYQTQGLLLITDDGQVHYRMTHPRFRVPRTYLVKVKGRPKPEGLSRITRGIRWKGDFIKAEKVRFHRPTRSNSWFEVTMHQGKYHEVRKLFAAIGHPVMRLVRTAYGPLKLGKLAVGEWRPLTAGEESRLKNYLKIDVG